MSWTTWDPLKGSQQGRALLELQPRLSILMRGGALLCAARGPAGYGQSGGAWPGSPASRN